MYVYIFRGGALYTQPNPSYNHSIDRICCTLRIEYGFLYYGVPQENLVYLVWCAFYCCLFDPPFGNPM